MLKISTTIVIATFLFACNTPSNTTGENSLSKGEKDDGWRLLFDGKTTKGWHQYGMKPVGAAWKVNNGSLCLDTAVKEGGDIVTDEEFDNFHLQLEWQISKNGNSGIIFYIHEDKTQFNWPWETGIEMQVLDNDGHPDGKIKTHRAGALFDLIAASPETVKPVGEWNLAEVKCVNGKLDLYLNGANIISTTLWDDNWKKLVAGSKFRNMPSFSKYTKGRIGLQDHGNAVCFRNVKIKKL